MDKKIKIGIWGTSITQGYNDFEEYGWVNRIRNILGEKIKPFALYNLGISAAMTPDILERFEVELKARKINVVVISAGTNDAAVQVATGKPRVSLEEYKNNLEGMITIARQYNVKHIIFTGALKVNEKLVSPCPWNTTLKCDNNVIVQYNDVLEQVAQNNDIVFVPLFDILSDKDLDDGLHPNSQGHQKMAEHIAPILEDNILK